MKNKELEIAIRAIEAAQDLREWISEKTCKTIYELEELKKKWEEVKSLEEMFDASHNGLLASYRDEFDDALKILTKIKNK